jgi:hypothetical protein
MESSPDNKLTSYLDKLPAELRQHTARFVPRRDFANVSAVPAMKDAMLARPDHPDSVHQRHDRLNNEWFAEVSELRRELLEQCLTETTHTLIASFEQFWSRDPRRQQLHWWYLEYEAIAQAADPVPGDQGSNL